MTPDSSPPGSLDVRAALLLACAALLLSPVFAGFIAIAPIIEAAYALRRCPSRRLWRLVIVVGSLAVAISAGLLGYLVWFVGGLVWALLSICLGDC
ncbi:hypothetical protein BH11ACT2_BH11ACT2_20760 [soil metagenome]